MLQWEWYSYCFCDVAGSKLLVSDLTAECSGLCHVVCSGRWPCFVSRSLPQWGLWMSIHPLFMHPPSPSLSLTSLSTPPPFLQAQLISSPPFRHLLVCFCVSLFIHLCVCLFPCFFASSAVDLASAPPCCMYPLSLHSLPLSFFLSWFLFSFLLLAISPPQPPIRSPSSCD